MRIRLRYFLRSSSVISSVVGMASLPSVTFSFDGSVPAPVTFYVTEYATLDSRDSVGYNSSTVEEQVATRGGLFCFAEDQRKGTLEKETQRAFSLVFFIATQKGVSIMTQKRSFITLSDEQSLAWYQHHVQVLHGYALALALKAGLSSAEAARLWENWHGGRASQPSQATLQMVEQQAK